MIFSFLNARLSISVKMSTLLLVIAVISTVVVLFIRNRASTKYSRLPKALDNDEKDNDQIMSEMWNEPNDSDTESLVDDKSNTTSFDEFLKAIKIFGFLDHEVFNELTKKTQTLRIQAGEKIRLADVGGFAVVISGSMKVFCRSETSNLDGTDSGYDLLNEITSSAPISSLSSILSLFSEEVNSEYNDLSEFDKVNASVEAVANELSTIVIIPASAFKKLTRKYQRATASIVQIILFRWSQVTFRTCQRYLNLTLQFYGTERLLNQRAAYRMGDDHKSKHAYVDTIVSKLKRRVQEFGSDVPFVRLTAKENKTRCTSPEVLSRTNSGLFSGWSYDIDLDSIKDSAEFPGPLMSHAQLNYGSDNPNLESIASRKQRFVSEDNDDKALRRAIVENMLSIIMIDASTVDTLPKCDLNSNSDNDNDNDANMSDNDNSSDSKSVYSDMFTAVPERDDDDDGGHDHMSLENEKKIGSYSFRDIIDDASEGIEFLWYRKGEYLGRYGERSPGLIYVLKGQLEVGQHTNTAQNEGSHYQKLYDVTDNCITGFLETISSYSSFVDLIATKDTYVARISREFFEKLTDTYPLLTISSAKALTTNLARPLVQLDFALEWISVKSGGKLLREGTSSKAVYFVLNGRMRAYHQKQLIGDFGHGSTIGELEMMSAENYSASVVAVRDTELSRFPRTLVESLARQYPSITFEMSRMVLEAVKNRSSANNNGYISNDFKTLAILPTSNGLPIEEFALKLSSSFESIGRSVKVLTNAIILRYLGKYAFHKMGVLKLKAYLADLEDRFDILLYVSEDCISNSWNRTCVDQADCVLLIADGAAQPKLSEIERMVVKSPTRSRAHLVFLQTDQDVMHGSSAKWLRNRPWISAHHHVQLDFLRSEDDTADPNGHGNGHGNGKGAKGKVKRTIAQIKNRVQDEIKLLQDKKLLKRYLSQNAARSNRLEYKNDFNRLARVLAGEAVGLVLGGGGARGISHIGVLQALEENGVPIDMIGGTSIGALIGGLYAKDYDLVPLLSKAKKFSATISSFWRLFLDLTYPVTAWTTGHAFNSAVWKALGNSRIEDFWVRYFTNTTNLTHSKMEIHERGYSWRYIRASMSLAGLLPPIEVGGNLLLDGGYVDNLPVTEMKRMGARYIIAVDVGAVDDTRPHKYGDTLSGIWALINKWNPLSSTPNAPNMAEIQQRLTYVSSVKALEEAKNSKDVIYLRPPIDNFATLDFGKFDEIREVGFKYGSTAIREKISRGEIPSIIPKFSTKESRPTALYRRYSF